MCKEHLVPKRKQKKDLLFNQSTEIAHSNKFQCVFTVHRKSVPVENKSFPQQTLSVSADKCEHGLHVKRASILNQLRFFHVVDGLCLDVMHDQLEGVLPLEI